MRGRTRAHLELTHGGIGALKVRRSLRRLRDRGLGILHAHPRRIGSRRALDPRHLPLNRNAIAQDFGVTPKPGTIAAMTRARRQLATPINRQSTAPELS
jgi:hypothetical protein